MNHLKNIRETSGLSQTDLVVATGISQGMISTIERSEEPNITLGTARKLARALNCTLDDLFPLDSEPAPAVAGKAGR